MNQEYYLNVPVDVITLDDIMTHVSQYIENNQQMTITSVNPQIVLEAHRYPEVLSYIQNATYRLPDGIGIVKASQLCEGQITERVTGIDVMMQLLSYANEHKEKIFLYGAKKEVVTKAATVIEQDYPGLSVVGAVDGYGSMSDKEIVSMINQSGATFLFVAKGFPLQEEWLAQYSEQLNVNIIEDVGGSFDVISGFVKRAPQWIQKMNLEWLYRSITQKGRLNRIFQIPVFLWQVKKEYNMKKRKE